MWLHPVVSPWSGRVSRMARHKHDELASLREDDLDQVQRDSLSGAA